MDIHCLFYQQNFFRGIQFMFNQERQIKEQYLASQNGGSRKVIAPCMYRRAETEILLRRARPEIPLIKHVAGTLSDTVLL